MRNHSGNEIIIPSANPLFAVLQRCLKTSKPFRDFACRKLAEHNFVCKVIIYTDDVTPGQVLQGEPARKTACVYWRLLGFGFPALSHERAWFVAATIRTGHIHASESGQNVVVKVVLSYVLWTAAGRHGTIHDLRNGVVVQFEDDAPPRMLFGDVCMLVEDALAHREVACIR